MTILIMIIKSTTQTHEYRCDNTVACTNNATLLHTYYSIYSGHNNYGTQSITTSTSTTTTIDNDIKTRPYID